MKTRAVPLHHLHTLKPEGMHMEEVEMQIGNTRIIIDLSYVNNRTEEQKRIDQANLSKAVWDLYEEEAG